MSNLRPSSLSSLFYFSFFPIISIASHCLYAFAWIINSLCLHLLFLLPFFDHFSSPVITIVFSSFASCFVGIFLFIFSSSFAVSLNPLPAPFALSFRVHCVTVLELISFLCSLPLLVVPNFFSFVSILFNFCAIFSFFVLSKKGSKFPMALISWWHAFFPFYSFNQIAYNTFV